MILQTKLFTSNFAMAKTPTPDGMSLEEQMNVFLASFPSRTFIVDINVAVQTNKTSGQLQYVGTIIFKQ